MTVRSALRAPVRAAVRAPIILRKRWTPAALFAQGQQGAWYEPKPEYLFQDAAGTTPVTADGDPVGYMQDLSGNGNHATQSTSAQRPIHTSPPPAIEVDGVDDRILIDDTPSLRITGDLLLCFAVKITNTGTGSSEGTIVAKRADDSAREFEIRSGGEGVRYLDSGTSVTRGSLDTGPKIVTLLRHSGTGTLRINGVAYTPFATAPTATAADIGIISRPDGSIPTNSGSGVLGGVLSDTVPSIYIVQQVERYLANLAGIQL